jgi:hypothetical protein
MTGFERLLVEQGAMFIGFFVLVGVAYLVFNAILKRD